MLHATTREPASTFVDGRRSADAAFHGIAPRELTVSALARLAPGDGRKRCLVNRGTNPLSGASICLATFGPCAEHAQLGMIEAFESLAIRVLQVFEGGPEVASSTAIVRKGI